MKKYVIACGICVFVLSGIVFYVTQLHTKGLFLHLNSLTWQRVMVSSPPLLAHLQYQQSPVKLCALRHGKYLLSLTLDNNRTLWWEFYHYDAGVRKRVDISIQRLDQHQVKFIQTYNTENLLFEGTVTIEATSEQHPYRLDWF